MSGFSYLAWFIVGGFSGALIGAVTHQWLRTIEDVVLGVLGAFVGGYLFGLIGTPGATFFWWDIFIAFVVAIALITMPRLIVQVNTKREHRSRITTVR